MPTYKTSIYKKVTVGTNARIMPPYYWLVTLMLSNFHQLNELDTSNFPECFSNKDMWNIYSKHFSFANTITVKILTIVNQNQNDVNDAANVILRSILSFVPGKTVEVQTTEIQQNGYIKVNDTPPRIQRSGMRYNVHTSKKYKIVSSSSEPEDAYLIIAWNEDSIYQYVQEMSSFMFPKSRALYVVLLISSEGGTGTGISYEVGRMLRMIWEKVGIFNIVAQVPCSQNGDDIYIYKPFGDTRRKRGLIQINKIKHVITDELLIINQFTRNMKKIPLNISLFEREPTSMSAIPRVLADYPIYQHAKNVTGFCGLDANIVVEMFHILNFEIKLNSNKNTYYGNTLKNGHITGSLGQVARREVQLSANGRFVDDYGTSDIEFTTVYNSDQICFITPKSQRKPQWMSIFYCFELSVWLIIMMVLATAIGVWYIYKKCVSKKTDVSRICLEVYSICFSIPVTISTSGAQSLFLGMLMLFNLVINGIFQGNLINSFSKSNYYPDINTLQELADSDLKIATSLNLFQEYHSEVFRELQEKVDYHYDEMSAMDKAAYLRTWVATERKSDAKLLLETKYTNEMGEPLLHIVNECTHSAFLAYIVPKGSPLLPRFNFIIQILLEGGFIEKWNNDIMEAVIAEKRSKMASMKNAPRQLSVRDFQAAFFVITAGYVTALIIFFVELLCKYRKLQRRQNVFMC